MIDNFFGTQELIFHTKFIMYFLVDTITTKYFTQSLTI